MPSVPLLAAQGLPAEPSNSRPEVQVAEDRARQIGSLVQVQKVERDREGNTHRREKGDYPRGRPIFSRRRALGQRFCARHFSPSRR
jgi:hypothetical protein